MNNRHGIHLLPAAGLVYRFLFGLWRSLVARPSGGRKVAGSSPASPTKNNRPCLMAWAVFLNFKGASCAKV